MDAFATAVTLSTLKTAENFLLVGFPHRILMGSEKTGGAFSLLHMECGPGAGSPPHLHEREDETFYVLSGELTFYANGEAKALGAGGSIFLPRNIGHHFKNTGSSPATFLVLMSPGGHFENYLRKVGVPATADYVLPPQVSPPTPEHIQKLLSEGSNFGIKFL